MVDWPLAVCDYQTINKADLQAIDTIFPHYAAEIYHLQHSKKHQWYYLSCQKGNEVLLFKTYDSDDTVAKRRCRVSNERCKMLTKASECGHCSFKLEPSNGDKTLSRESVEVRAMVIYS